MPDNKIIVLTPVRNEAWILNQFLSSTSFFADCIIIADQQSTDDSRIICSKYPKVHLIENKSETYDEASRQVLLIEKARELFPDDKRILFCLDTDELFSANSLDCADTWEKLRNLIPGTAIYIEKPDILNGIKKCVRWKDNYFPIGYVDDGFKHTAQNIHSKRIPSNPNGYNEYINDIKILHFAHTRKNVQSAKLRYYAVIENINHSKPYYLRRYAYPCFYNEKKNYPAANIEPITPAWLKKWGDLDIDLYNLDDPQFSWHDFEVLNFFQKYGCKKFWWDNLWGFDWETCASLAHEKNPGSASVPILKPGVFLTIFLKLSDILYLTYRKLKF